MVQMEYIKGTSRFQSRIVCLDDMVDKKARVRIIDRFVDSVDLAEMGFGNTAPKQKGRHPYSPALMVKLYMFGYEKGVRSSRKLEAMCHTDVEAMWLTEDLAPDFKTIANFRCDNIAPFVALFARFASFLDSMGLYGKKTVAIDGTKIKASNSKKRHFTAKKLDGLIEYNEAKAKEYLGRMDDVDGIDDRAGTDVKGTDDETSLKEKAKRHIRRAEHYRAMRKDLVASGANSVATTDADAHLMGVSNFGQDMAYNIQAAVDGKGHLVCEFGVSESPTDYDQLSVMAQKAKEALGTDDTVYLADKGYWSSPELIKCEEAHLDVIVAPQKPAHRKEADARFGPEHFEYDLDTDSYLCPNKRRLTSRSKKTTKNRSYHNAKACRSCEYKDVCVPKGSSKKVLRRHVGSDALDKARARYAVDATLYKKRQQIIEHVFGTIKKTMHGDYLLLRSKPKVKAEMALMFCGYNLKRLCSLLGFDDIMVGINEYALKNGCRSLHDAVCAAKSLLVCVICVLSGLSGPPKPAVRHCRTVRSAR
jgi:transposase